MYIELTCKECGKSFRVVFGSQNEFDLENCPKCGCVISRISNAELYGLTEKIYDFNQHAKDVVINRVHADNEASESDIQLVGDLFHNDIAHLAELFNHSSIEVQKKMAALMDKLYLLTYHDAKGAKIEVLDQTLERLQEVFLKKCEEKHAETGRILGIE